ncbi:ENTH/VHS [Penicillium camemberti]|uniref:ENTH/VHS n=1 Tax=Penicillium camemberti (strain FM 013) TaxID=1429867 RepID=A0A0G4PF46_PENC3|nr:ENTH/VHS [Penicillium camemberti]
MKRFLGSLSRRSSSSDSVEPREDSPEAIVLKELTAFCESRPNENANGSSRDAQGNEFVHLPRIVEAAESSPNAAKEAALRIRKYLSDPAGNTNHTQYNAIMLMRILVDNPGHTFTRNFDAKFVTTVKELLRTGRDWHVQSSLRQYLDTLEQQRAWDDDLKLLLQMWAKEKTKASHGLIDRFPMNSIIPPQVPARPPGHQQQPYIQPRASRNTLPTPVELAARIEEARNSAKLLTQFVQSTPPVELEGNDLIKEFVDRCGTASRMIQGYIQTTNPAPDEDTLLTLIETNDEISVALSQQQRAMLKARKIRGSSSPTSSNLNSPSPTSQVIPPAATNFSPPPSAPPRTEARSPEVAAPVAAPVATQLPSPTMTGGRPLASHPVSGSATTSRYEYNSEDFQVRNPFADDYATNDSNGSNRVHGNSQPQGDRVRFQPTEQER